MLSVKEVLGEALSEATCPASVTVHPVTPAMIILEPDAFGVSASSMLANGRMAFLVALARARAYGDS